MSEFVANGSIADVALAVIALEAALLGWFRRGRGAEALLDVGPFLAAGAGLLVALRAALAGSSTTVIVAALAFAGVAHVLDLARRLRG